jgi:hypothetical protein
MRETRSSGSVRGASGNGRPYRERNLAVAARSGEGPFTIRFADLHDRAMQTSGWLSWRSKAEGKLDGGESNEGAQGFGKVLEVLGETAQLPSRS